MLSELAERDATGAIRAIYGEIRRLWAVPYVSSMQRHLATHPGLLEWVWMALRPTFASGHAQTRAWTVVDRLALPDLPPISQAAMRVWGVDAAGLTSIRAVCASFVRVSPVNLVFAGLLRLLLAGERPSAPGRTSPSWTPPPELGPLPAMVDAAALPDAERGVLASVATMEGGEPFVPGLYRMLGRWPAFLAHVATERGRLADPDALVALARVNELVDAEVGGIFASLPALPRGSSRACPADVPGVQAALDTYRRTSPEMVVMGRMLERALPVAETRH